MNWLCGINDGVQIKKSMTNEKLLKKNEDKAQCCCCFLLGVQLHKTNEVLIP